MRIVDHEGMWGRLGALGLGQGSEKSNNFAWGTVSCACSGISNGCLEVCECCGYHYQWRDHASMGASKILKTELTRKNASHNWGAVKDTLEIR